MIKQVDRYIGRASLSGILLVWLGLTLLIVLFDLMSELRSLRGAYDTKDAFWYMLLMAPHVSYQVFPVSALLGALLGVGGLAAANELVAFRTSGVSRLRLAGAAMGGAMLLIIPVTIIAEYIAPAATQQARAFRLNEQVGRVIVGGPRGMWLRDGQDIINIQSPLLQAGPDDQAVSFLDVVIYQFADANRLAGVIRAENASHDGEQWTLEEVSNVHFNDQGAVEEQTATMQWPSEVKPELLDSAITRPSQLSLRSLNSYLAYLGQNGLDDRVYQSVFWERVIFPFASLMLVLAGMPFVFGSSRHHNIGVRLFIGMCLGGLFMIVSRTAQNFGDAYQIPAMVSNALPSVLLGLIAIVVLRRSV